MTQISQFDADRAGSQAHGPAPSWPSANSRDMRVAALLPARLHQDRQRSSADVRTDASAPRMAGLKNRQDVRQDRCLKVSRNPHVVSYSGKAVQGSTLYPTLPMPIILSATVHTHRHNLPGLPLDGCRRSFEVSSRLHPALTIPPVQPNPLYRRVRLSPRGRRLGQKMTGAAIQDR